VIGNEFALRLLGKVTGNSDLELNRMLAELQSAEFIYEQPATGEVEYAFKHALTQEVAYGSVLQERRKVIHERVGQSIETLYDDSLDDYVSNLAHHYRRSGNIAKAVAYLIRAADQAHRRSALLEAAAYFDAALERVKDLPGGAERDRQEIAIHTGLGDVDLVTKGYAAGDYERHQTCRQALAERLGDGVQLFFCRNFGAFCISARVGQGTGNWREPCQTRRPGRGSGDAAERPWFTGQHPLVEGRFHRLARTLGEGHQLVRTRGPSGTGGGTFEGGLPSLCAPLYRDVGFSRRCTTAILGVSDLGPKEGTATPVGNRPELCFECLLVA
jgi:hypothetical protein